MYGYAVYTENSRICVYCLIQLLTMYVLFALMAIVKVQRVYGTRRARDERIENMMPKNVSGMDGQTDIAILIHTVLYPTPQLRWIDCI
jgi:hypothetical protein